MLTLHSYDVTISMLIKMNLVFVSVCLCVRVFRSHLKSQHHDILTQGVISPCLVHDKARFFLRWNCHGYIPKLCISYINSCLMDIVPVAWFMYQGRAHFDEQFQSVFFVLAYKILNEILNNWPRSL